MTSKLFRPFIIINFVLFMVALFSLMVNGDDGIYKIVVFLSYIVDVVFVILQTPRCNHDKIHGIEFAIVIFFAGQFSLIIDGGIFSLILYLISSIIYFVRLITMYDKRKIVYLFITIISLCFSLSFYFFKIIDDRLAIIIDIILNNIISISLMVYYYRNRSINEKANWFFGSIGIMIFAICLLLNRLGSTMPNEAILKSLIESGSLVFLIPSISLSIISFIKFEDINS